MLRHDDPAWKAPAEVHNVPGLIRLYIRISGHRAVQKTVPRRSSKQVVRKLTSKHTVEGCGVMRRVDWCFAARRRYFGCIGTVERRLVIETAFRAIPYAHTKLQLEIQSTERLGLDFP
jgi:hypothetical protein